MRSFGVSLPGYHYLGVLEKRICVAHPMDVSLGALHLRRELRGPSREGFELEIRIGSLLEFSCHEFLILVKLGGFGAPQLRRHLGEIAAM